MYYLVFDFTCDDVAITNLTNWTGWWNFDSYSKLFNSSSTYRRRWKTSKARTYATLVGPFNSISDIPQTLEAFFDTYPEYLI